jgi:hypothetical protein
MSRPVLAMLILVPALRPDPAAAQSVRISGTTSMRYVELRTLVRDSIASEATDGSGLLRQLPDGRVVRCIPGEEFCRDVRPGPVVSDLPIIQDLEVSVWGVGKGLRLFTHLRGRMDWSGNPEIWPQGDDWFDLLAAYVDFERPRLHLRAGRQWKVSGLGFYNFDGLSLGMNALPGLWLEAYAGRSLVRGLNEPHNSGALQSIESLAPSAAGVLLGFEARYRPVSRLALSALYQMDVRTDREGLYSELVVADGVWGVGGGSAEATVEVDVASGQLNQARLHLRSPPLGTIAPFVEVRRYRPYFELWTIWGAFSPVGFDEARGGLVWASRDGRLSVRGDAGYRGYEDAGVDESIDEYRDNGWGVGASIGWSPVREWRLGASYRVETGFGAARQDGQAGVTRNLGTATSITLQGLVFQRLYEFRLSEGTVAGLGGEVALRLTDRVQLFASLATYRHLGDHPTSGPDWSQERGSLVFQWTLGSEPGLSTRRSRP